MCLIAWSAFVSRSERNIKWGISSFIAVPLKKFQVDTCNVFEKLEASISGVSLWFSWSVKQIFEVWYFWRSVSRFFSNVLLWITWRCVSRFINMFDILCFSLWLSWRSASKRCCYNRSLSFQFLWNHYIFISYGITITSIQKCRLNKIKIKSNVSIKNNVRQVTLSRIHQTITVQEQAVGATGMTTCPWVARRMPERDNNTSPWMNNSRLLFSTTGKFSVPDFENKWTILILETFFETQTLPTKWPVCASYELLYVVADSPGKMDRMNRHWEVLSVL